LLILALGLAFSAGVCREIAKVQGQREKERFSRTVQQARSAITARIETYITILRSTTGLFYASEDVTRDEFHQFMEQTRILSTYPGIQGIGFSARSPDGSRDVLERWLEEAYPGEHVRLHDAGEPHEEHTVLFLEPLDAINRNALGFNMFSENVRRRAMEDARDSGEAKLSGMVTLVQEPRPAAQRAFLIYMPLYGPDGDPGIVEARRRELRGYVYAAFRTGDLFGAVFAEGDPPVEYVLFDSVGRDADGLIYSSPGYAERREAPSGFDVDTEIVAGGRRWSGKFVPGMTFDAARPADLVPLVAVSGVLLSLLLWGIASVQSYVGERTETAALELARSKEELEESEARKGAILASAMDAIITMDEAGRVLEWNPAAARMFMWEEPGVSGRTLHGLVSHQTPGLDVLTLRAAEGRRYETVLQRANGETFPAEISVCRVAAPGPARFTGFIRDITERARAEHHRQLMTRELDHRVKNNLSTVMAILGESARRASTKDGLVQALTGRLRALATLHEMLSVRKWQGADLRDLVDRTLAPHRGKLGPDANDRVQVHGEDVHIPGKVASALCMAIHELATNAAKYGALSVAEGRVDASWLVEAKPAQGEDCEKTLVFEWREGNGPEVHPPGQNGFGTELIQGGIAFETGGTTQIAYERSGVRCTMRIPLARQTTDTGSLGGPWDLLGGA
jgi:PAS domain S-box-containing protein